MKKLDKIRLILPSPEMKNQAMAMREAFFAAGERKIYGTCGLHHFTDFGEWLVHIRRQIVIPGGEAVEKIPATTYFAVRTADAAIVGAVNIRHFLTESVYHNGHIGYSVHPAERGKGYGREVLRLALIKANELGILEPVVTCRKHNTASKRVIEANKLRFVREHADAQGVILIYALPVFT
jgi:predicted acetyltransferase